MNKTDKIYVAGHRGLVGSAIVRNLKAKGYENVIGRTHKELDLTNQQAVRAFFEAEHPDVVVLAAAKVGGINANNTTPADFAYENMQIQCNVISCCHLYQVKKLLFLGSTCIYPRMAPQPIPEDALLTGPLEETNEAYAIAKIAGLEMCKRFVDAGVVDPDIVANSGDALRDKMAQCKVGMAVTEWASVYKQALMEQLLAVDPDAEWVWYAPLDSGTGDRACFDTRNAVGSKGEWCVSAAVAESPEKLEAVIKLLNYITSEEGEKLVSYGVEGRHYNVENGEIVKTDLMSTECDFLWVYQMAYRDDGVYLAVKFPEAAESIVFSENTERMTAYENAVIAPEGFHAEDMNKYITENMIAFIFGTRPISEYSQFLEELNTSFGFEDYMKSAEEQLREQGYIE